MSFKQKTKHIAYILYHLVRHPRKFYHALSARGKKWAMRGLILLLIILVAIPASFWYQARNAKAAWFDENWMYRQATPVTNNGAQQNNVYSVVTVNTSDTSRFQNDCGDIRFTNLHGSQLSYYIESGCGTASTIIDVAFDTLPAGVQTIYMYYGNPSATNGFTAAAGSGSVIEDNMRLSTANGTAFADFSAANTLTQFSANRLAIKDSASKKLNGFIKAAGMGETYSSELVTNGNMETGNPPSSWGVSNGSTLAQYSPGNGGTGYALSILRGPGVPSAVQVLSGVPPSSEGKLYKASLVGQKGATSGYIMMVKDWCATAISMRSTTFTDSSWGAHTFYGTLPVETTTNAQVMLYPTSSGTFYIDDVSVQQVLTPSTTGVTVTSTSGGSTYNWKSEDSGFNRNDTSNYTYIVYPLAFSTEASSYSIGSLGAEEIGPGPLAYWKLDEGQGNTAYNSTSQTGINGTLQNSPTWKAESDCVSGKCLQYNGTNQYVSVDDTGTTLDFDAAKQYTWSAWINYSGFPAGHTQQCFLSKDLSTPKGQGFNLCLIQNGSSADFFVNYRDIYSSNLGIGLPSNSWAHVEVEYDGASNWKVYLNGAYKGSIAFSVPSDTTAKYFIGAACQSSNAGIQVPVLFFQGKIDAVKIYPYQRSEAQIKTDYNSGKSGSDSLQGTSATVGASPKWMTDGLVGQWKMDETSGTTVADASGNGNTGTLTNAQETGTAQTGSSTTAITDSGNAALSTTDNAYNNMILQITSGALNGTQRTITGYTGATKTFTFAAFGSDPTGATYIILHQTGGKFGNGLAFEGNSSEYVNIANNATLNPTNEVTVSAWIKLNSLTFWQQPVNKGSGGNAGYRIGYGSLNNFYFETYTSSSVALYASNPSPISINTWYNVVGTYKDGQISICINGNCKSSNVTGGQLNTGAGALQLGAGSNFGAMDDVRIYNRALSPDEVKQLSEWGPGPVGWWKMDDGVKGNNQTIADSSGIGNNLTTNWGGNASGMDCQKNGKYGSACESDGVDDKMSSSSNDFNIKYGFTREAWIKPNSAAMTSGISFGWGCLMRVHQSFSDRYQNFCRIGGTYAAANSAAGTLVDNTWQHVAFTYDMYSRTLLFYINGVLVGSNTLSGLPNYDIDTSFFGSGTLDIGGEAFSSGYYHGLTDDVRVYNYARTPKQVVEDMNAGHPVGGSPVGSQVAYWKFNEGQGNTAYDSGVSQNNATLTAGAAGGNTQPGQMWDNGAKFGKALEFDGDDYASAANTRLDGRSFSITAWAYANDITQDRCIFGQQESGATNKSLHLRILSTGAIRLGFYNNDLTSAAGIFPAGSWHHLGFTYDSLTKTRAIYYDGKQVASDTSASDFLGASGSDFIGAWQSALQNWKGKIDELKIYYGALTPDQIALDMNQGKELQLGAQVSATGATGQAAEYCVPGDATSCAGPVGEWKFDEGSSGTVHDTSGSGNDGTWFGTGGHWTVDGKYNNAGSFNGSSDYVSMPETTSGTAYTAEAWVKPTSVNVDNYLLANMGGLQYFDVSIQSDGSKKLATMARYNGGNNYWPESNGTIPAGVWSHVVFIIQSGVGYKFYINGRLDKDYSEPTISFGSSTGTGYIGEFPSYGFFGGGIDQAQIYNYVRTPAQIAWDYNRGKPVGWWKMDEGQGGSASDSSGNNNAGTLTNMDPPNDWVDGKFGKALDFDGSNDYVNVPVVSGSTLKVTGAVALGGWVKFNRTGVDEQLFGRGNATGADADVGPYAIAMYGSTNILYWTIGNGSTTTRLPYSFTPQLNRWYHIMGTWDGTTGTNGQKLYIDGRLVTQTTSSLSQTRDDFNFRIATDNWPVRYFQGQIDDVRVYNYALTQTQVQQIMNNGSEIRFGDQ